MSIFSSHKRGISGLLAGSALLAAVTAAPASDDEAIVGKALFRRLWVPAPTRTDAADGLGPLFNARSCATCHPGGGGALARQAADGVPEVGGIVFRIADRNGHPHPHYGKQLQTHAVPGLTAEAKARLVIDPSSPGGVRADVELLDGAIDESFKIGPRIAPSLRGRDRIEKASEAAIRARAEPAVQASLGLSGRARFVHADGVEELGRFGWKASELTLADQAAEAFATDLGLSSPQRPKPYGDCTAEQTACLAFPNGESPAFEGRELSSAMVRAVARYVATLEAPTSGPSPAGDALLAAAKCTACHVPELPAEGGGTVSLYSDLLLHDMGPGLDDGVAEPGVRSSEWRTAPLLDLWTREGSRRYLHDGRAASVLEAIRAHGGEADASRQAFEALSPGERADFVRDLETR